MRHMGGGELECNPFFFGPVALNTAALVRSITKNLNHMLLRLTGRFVHIYCFKYAYF
jgi:hypothetical protein